MKKIVRWGKRQFNLPTGEQVSITWGIVDKIKIIARVATGYRLWASSPQDVSIHIQGDKLVATELHKPHDWSAGYQTFAYASAGEVIVKRAGVEQSLGASAGLPKADTMFYTPTVAALSANGVYAVVLPTTLLVTRIARVATWNGMTSTWGLRDIPLPPGVATAAGLNDTHMATAAQDLTTHYWAVASSENSVTISLPPAPLPFDFVFGPPELPKWRVYVDPYTLVKVYVDVRYWEVEAEIIGTDGLGVAGGACVLGTSTPTQQVWSYDLATDAWALEYTHPGETSSVWGAVEHSDGVSYGLQTGGPGLISNHVHYQPVFSPQGGMHIATCDNRDLPESSGITSVGTVSGSIVVNIPYRDQVTRHSPADYVLDGGAWVPGATVSSAVTGSASNILIELGTRVLQVATGADDGPRGALRRGFNVRWRWGTVADVNTFASDSSPTLFSLALTRMYLIGSLAYENGVLLYDPTPDPQVDFTVLACVSYSHEDYVYGFIVRIGPVVHVPDIFDGTITSPFFPGTLPMSDALIYLFGDPNGGFAADGVHLYTYNPGTGLITGTYTAAEMADMFGGTYEFAKADGILVPAHDAPGAPVSTYELMQYSSDTPVTKLLVDTSWIVPSVDPDFPVNFDGSIGVPDECVAGT